MEYLEDDLNNGFTAEPKSSHAENISVVTTKVVETGDANNVRPAGRKKRKMRRFWGGRSSGFELDPRLSHDIDDPLVCHSTPNSDFGRLG